MAGGQVIVFNLGSSPVSSMTAPAKKGTTRVSAQGRHFLKENSNYLFGVSGEIRLIIMQSGKSSHSHQYRVTVPAVQGLLPKPAVSSGLGRSRGHHHEEPAARSPPPGIQGGTFVPTISVTIEFFVSSAARRSSRGTNSHRTNSYASDG